MASLAYQKFGESFSLISVKGRKKAGSGGTSDTVNLGSRVSESGRHEDQVVRASGFLLVNLEAQQGQNWENPGGYSPPEVRELRGERPEDAHTGTC